MMPDQKETDTRKSSAASAALAAAGDRQQAQDVGDIEAAYAGVDRKLGVRRTSLVERLIYGPRPGIEEICSGGASMANSATGEAQRILDHSLDCLAQGRAFEADGKLSSRLRETVASDKAYGFTVPVEYGGLGLDYSQLARLEEDFVANGLGALAVEVSGQLTIGSSALLGYGSDEQRSTFLPLIASGELTAFGLTEVGVGVNAKKVRAYVEKDEENGCWRLFAEGQANKLYITNATHGGLMAIVARRGREGRQIGLFVLRLPETDVEEGDYRFSCSPANASAFMALYNSRLSFHNFPIPLENAIEGDGVEVLFYCLRMGRCMLAAMCAGYQRMMAADATHYARQRIGVGGEVIRHELPRLGLGRMLGGALVAQSLAHLSLRQDADGVDLAGLRDITKSASASAAMTSLIACERVMGGRSMDKGSRITEARPNIHVFGIVEGEDDLIRLGMVKDITARFTERYMAGMLGALQQANQGGDGNPVDAGERLYGITPATFLRYPRRSLRACAQLVTGGGLWALVKWVAQEAGGDLLRLPGRLVPTVLLPRYAVIPAELRAHLRYAERQLRRCRWLYLGLNLCYQLELTRAQIPMQRLGRYIEQLVALVALCGHAVHLDASQRKVAALQAELIREELVGIRVLRGSRSLARLRRQVMAVGQDLEAGRNTLISTVDPQPFAHPWAEGETADQERDNGSTR